MIVDGSRLVIAGVPASRKTRLRYGISKYTPPKGSLRSRCNGCGKQMWLGPKQIEAIKKDPQLAESQLCMICVATDRAKSKEPGVIAHLGGDGGDYEYMRKN